MGFLLVIFIFTLLRLKFFEVVTRLAIDANESRSVALGNVSSMSSRYKSVSKGLYKGEVFSENAARERSERPERRQRRNNGDRRPQNRDGRRPFKKNNAEEGNK